MPSQTFFNLPNEKQERIMDAIINEMGMHTYESFNFANVIRDSGISRGSFYQYFEDKNDLFEYFYLYVGQKKIRYFGDLYTGEEDIPFLDRFLQLYLRGFKFGFENPALMKAAQTLIISNHHLNSQMVKNASEQAKNLFVDFIKKDITKGRIKQTVDPELLASFLLEFSNKVSLEEYFKNEVDFVKIEQKIRQLVEMLQKGIE